MPKLRRQHGKPDLSPEARALVDRIMRAIQEADLAYWDKIAREFPEVKSGDFGPEETFRWHNEMEEAVLVWLANNFPRSRALTEILHY